MTPTDQVIHAAAVRCNATVMGDAPDHHYIMNADELRRFVRIVTLPPCPVPLPNSAERA